MKKENFTPSKTVSNYQIDNLDRQILACLMEDVTRPYTDIAQQLLVSNGTIHVRMKKLREMGIVTGATLTVDARQLGFDIIAFVGILLEKDLRCDDAMAAMQDIPEIVEAYYITGTYGLLIKIMCRSSAHLLHILREKIQTIEGVKRTETFILLEEGIRRPVPLDETDQDR